MSTTTSLTRLSRYGESCPAPLNHGHAYSYSVTIESAAKYEQRPETMDSIKRAFRSIFKRGSKKRKDDRAQQSASTSRQQPQTPSRDPTKSGSSPPTAPPKDTPKAVEPNTTGHLPPRHPLATRRQDDGLQGRGVPSAGLGSREPESERVSREEPGTTTTLSPRGHSDSVPVSAISREGTPAPVNAHGATGAVVAAPPEAASAAPAVTETQPAHIQSTGEPERSSTVSRPFDSRPQSGENAPPSASEILPSKSPPRTPGPDIEMSATTATTTATTQLTTKPTSLIHQRAPSFEGKILASEPDEPPPIKPIQAAPGMSATSGPLEDFPEGEFRF